MSKCLLRTISCSITYGQKSSIVIGKLCAHEYEYTSHIVTFYISCFQTFIRFYTAWTFIVIPPLLRRRGDRIINSEQYREHIKRTFNAFCKIVLCHVALNGYKKLRKKQQFEVPLDYLCEFDFEPVITTYEYFVKYDVPTVFTVCGKMVIVESEQLAAALLRLPEKRREVLFLRYYLGYNDVEIRRLFGVCRSAIFHRRKIVLRLLRIEMEALENEK